MSAIHWLTSINGNFTNTVDWSGGKVPGASDTAILDAVGSAYTVTSSGDETVKSIELSSNAVLAITGGTFSAIAGTGRGANAGTITISGPGVLSVGGGFDNEGLISLTSTEDEQASLIAATNTTLTGGGTISGASINAAVDGITITNVNNTINSNLYPLVSGLTFINEKDGIVATGDFGGNYFDTVSIVNFGTIESIAHSGVGHCNISGSGVISVGSGDDFNIGGGNTVVEGQQFFLASGSTVYLAALEVEYSGVLDESGEMYLYRGGADGELHITGDTTLLGGGTVNLFGGTVSGAGSTFINVDDTIQGAGNLGSGQINIVNQADGVIDAIPDYFASSLVIDCGAATLVNAGLIEAAVKHTALTIVSAVDNTGTIAGKNISLDGTLVNDGLILAHGLFVVDGPVSGTGSVRIDRGTLDFASSFAQSVTFKNTGNLELAESQDYTGTIEGFGANDGSSVDLRDIGFVSADEATYSGTVTRGILTVTDGTHTASIHFKGDYLTVTFVASSDGHGGVDIVANSADAPAAFPHAFISAMAGLSAPAGAPIRALDAGAMLHQPLLAARSAQA